MSTGALDAPNVDHLWEQSAGVPAAFELPSAGAVKVVDDATIRHAVSG